MRARGCEGVVAMMLVLMASACRQAPDEGFVPVGGEGGAGGSGGSAGSAGSGGVSPGGAGGVGGSNPGGAGGAGGAGGSNAGGAGGAGGGGSACVDDGIGEPNDTEPTAVDLGAISDCDGDGSSVAGVLAPGDVDWYRYAGADTFGCVVDATRSITSSEPVRLCKFVECASGVDATFSCPSGTTSATSPAGRVGCCAGAGFDFGPDCSGTDDDAVVFVRIDAPLGATCASYTLGYHF